MRGRSSSSIPSEVDRVAQRLLSDAVDDFISIAEIVPTVNGCLPGLDPQRALALARMAVDLLAVDGLIGFVRGNPDPLESHALSLEAAKKELASDALWNWDRLPTDHEIWLIASARGRDFYLSHPIGTQQ
jgi:hypothetical protein